MNRLYALKCREATIFNSINAKSFRECYLNVQSDVSVHNAMWRRRLQHRMEQNCWQHIRLKRWYRCSACLFTNCAWWASTTTTMLTGERKAFERKLRKKDEDENWLDRHVTNRKHWQIKLHNTTNQPPSSAPLVPCRCRCIMSQHNRTSDTYIGTDVGWLDESGMKTDRELQHTVGLNFTVNAT